MPAFLAAAIDLRGSTLRFAAIEGPAHGEPATPGTSADAGQPLLRALGDVAFDADAWTLLGQPSGADDVATAVGDVFAGLRLSRLTVVAHADAVPTWSAATGPNGAARLAREADLLLGGDPRYAGARVAASPLGHDADGRAWVQAVALTAGQEAGLARVAAALGLTGAEVRVAPHAVSRLVPRTATPPLLLVGLHRGEGAAPLAEFALVDGTGLRLVGHAPTADAVEASFAAVRLVAAAGVRSGIGALVVYGSAAGDAATVGAFEAAVGVRASRVDPFASLSPLPRSGALQGLAPVLAPVVGAALAGLGG